MGQILLFLFGYHLLGVVIALIVENYQHDLRRWARIFAPVLLLVLLASCETAPPIKVGLRPDIAGIRKQNDETIKQTKSTRAHVQEFKESNRKVREEAIESATAIELARKYVLELLGENP